MASRRDVARTPVSNRELTGALALDVAIVDGSGNHITSFGGAGGTSSTDEAAYTAGASTGTPVMGAFDDAAPDTLAEGTLGIIRATTNRALHVNLRDAAGAELAVGGGTQYTEDAVAAANPTGNAPMLVRQDTPAGLVTTDGDNVAQRGTNYGAAYTQIVTSAGAFVDSFGGGTQYTEGDVDATITGTALMWEDAGNTLRPVAAATPLPVDITDATVAVTQSGGWTVSVTGSVDTELPTAAALADNAANPTAPAVGAFNMLWDGATWDRAPGTSADGLLVNLGANNDVTVTTMPGTFVEDASAGAGGETGHLALAVRKDADTANVGADNDYATLLVDARGLLKVEAFSGEALPVTDNGSSLSVDDGAGSLTVDNAALSVTGGGVEATALRVTIASDSTGLLSVDDNGGTLTVDAPIGTPVNVQVGDGSNTATIRNLAANDALNVAIVDGSGGHITSFGGGTQFAEDATHTTGDVGTMALAVRNDAGTALAANGDYIPLMVNASGALYVTGGGGGTEYVVNAAAPADPTGTAGLMERDDALSALTEIEGDWTNMRSNARGALWVELDTTNSVPVTNTVLSVVGGGTEAAAQRVTIANDSTGVLSVDDNGASLTVDNATLSVVGGGTEATALRVTIANDSTGVVSIDDNGGAITVDGTVAISGTVDTELPTAAALADNTANPTVPGVGSFLMGYDGTNWDRVRADGGSVFIQDGGNSITVDGTVGVSGSVDTELPTAAALSDNFANPTAPGVGAFNMVWDGATWDRAPGTSTDGILVNLGTNNDVIQATASNLNAQVVGAVAHDSGVGASNPVLVAARANANEPTAVADADVTHLWADTFGRLVTVAGHPSPEAPAHVNATASGNTTVIGAPGVGVSLYIKRGSVHNSATTNRTVLLQDGAGGTTRWGAELASEGGGSLFDFGDRGWKLTSNTLLNANLDAAGDVRINVTDYYIAA